MDQVNSTRLRNARPLFGALACIAILFSTSSEARRISIDFAGGTGEPGKENGDAWVFDSQDCQSDSAAAASCGLSFGTQNVVAVQLGFSVKIGDSDVPIDTVYVSKFGFLTFGLAYDEDFTGPPASPNAFDLSFIENLINPVGNRPFIAPYYSDPKLPDRAAEDFQLFSTDDNGTPDDPGDDFLTEQGGASIYRATADPFADAVDPNDPDANPYKAADLVPAFAATWYDPANAPGDPEGAGDQIRTQVVIYKHGDNGDFDFNIRYGSFDQSYVTSNPVLPGVAGYSLKTQLDDNSVGLPGDAGSFIEPLDGANDADYFFCVRNGHIAPCEGTDTDADDDNVDDATDNCPAVANTEQQNTDGDAQGDACDADDDNDGIADSTDNCPLASNANQANNDGDAQGDICDTDDDNDGVADSTDNCPKTPNANQADSDRNGVGDACQAAPPAPLRCDADSDRDVDVRDLEAILRAVGRSASGPTDPRDFDRNGRIQLIDVLGCTTRCTRKLCSAR